MKTTTQNIRSKNCKTTTALLLLGLGLIALASTMEIAQAAKPPPWVPSQAVSVYPEELYSEGIPFDALISHVPGNVCCGSVIGWGWYYQAEVNLGPYRMGVGGIYINLFLDSANQVVSIRLKGQAGPVGEIWPWHDTDIIPVANTPVFDLVNGFTLQIRTDHIPVWAYATAKTNKNSPRVGVVGSVSLGDLVISPRP